MTFDFDAFVAGVKPAHTGGIKINAGMVEAFAAAFMSHRYDEAKPTPAFHREAWELYASDIPAVAIAAPRNHAKTTALTVDFIVATVLFRSEDYIMILGSSEEMAIEHLQNISGELHENDSFAQANPDFEIKRFLVDQKAEIVVEMKDGYVFRIIARGGEQKVRGRLWRGKRPGLIVCHAKGTPIYDYDLGRWMFVQAHPTAKEWMSECLQITLALLEDDEHNEVVSNEHYYYARRGATQGPEWIRACDLRVGDLIGDPDGSGVEAGIQPEVARGKRGARERAEQAAQCSLSGAASAALARASRRLDSGQSGEAQTGQARPLPAEQGSLRRKGASLLERAQGQEERSCSYEESACEIGDTAVGELNRDQGVLRARKGTRVVCGSYRADQLQDCVRPTLRGEPANDVGGQELGEAQSVLARHAVGAFVADGFIWRPIINVVPVGRRTVVAVRTKSGFYKTKFGMSHNCDDL